MEDELEILPSPMGMIRFEATRGYFEGLGEGHRKPCTCTMDCRVMYCTGRECGCEACALELGHKLSEDEVTKTGGFGLPYSGAMLRYGKNVADYLSPLWADQKPLHQRFIKLAPRLAQKPFWPPDETGQEEFLRAS